MRDTSAPDDATDQIASDQIVNYYSAIDLGDTEAALSVFAPHARYSRPGHAPLRDGAEIADFYRRTRRIREGHHVIECVLRGDDWVAVKGSFTGVSTSGDPLSTRFADFWHCEGGRVDERETFFDGPQV